MREVTFLGGKEVGARCLEQLIERSSDLGFRISAVLPTPQGVTVRELAEKHELPIVSTLGELPDCDVMISVQYHQILKIRDIQKAKSIAVNLHMAPLPEYRGCNQFSLAIINDDKEFGVTIHQLTEGIDSGPIISERRFPVPERVWVNELVDISTDESVKLFRESIESLVLGSFELMDQSKLIPKRGTSLSFRKDVEKLKQLDLNWDAERLDRYIRALSMPGFEPPHAVLGTGDRVYFRRGGQHD
jgi:methionyl-tRNA formyltransferase